MLGLRQGENGDRDAASWSSLGPFSNMPAPSCPLASPVPVPFWQRHPGVDAQCPLEPGSHSRPVGLRVSPDK